MSPRFFALALTATLFAGIVAQADESGSRYRRRPAPQPQVQQQPDDQYYDGQDYQEQGQGYQQGGGVVVGGGYQQGCCAPPMPPPPIECCVGGGYPPRYMPYVPPVAVPYGPAYGGGVVGGGCRVIGNNVGWTVIMGGRNVMHVQRWQQWRLSQYQQMGCVFQ